MVRPLLEAAGFRRTAAEFVRHEASGLASVIRFAKDGDGFAVQYGTVTPGLLAFEGAQGFDRSIPSPEISSALLFAQLFRPGFEPDSRSDLTPYRWRPDVVADEDVPARLAEAFTQRVLPDLYRWSDPLALADAILEDRTGTFPGLPLRRAVAMALFEASSPTRLDAAMADLDPDDIIRRWIESHQGMRGATSPDA